MRGDADRDAVLPAGHHIVHRLEPKVLEDLFGWLSNPVRDFKKITILSSQAP
jgi:hypothetical protein